MTLKIAAFVLAFLTLSSYQTLTESCEIYKFVKQEGRALVDHVIKTISRGLVEVCWSECVGLPECLSMNVRVVLDVIFECELNNSTKEGSPGSMVRRQGSEYHEMADVDSKFCNLYECIRKQVLPDGWFGLGSFALKLFSQSKNWTDARQYCKSRGGELVSIVNSYKDNFVYHLLAKNLINSVNSNKRSGSAQPTDSYWALDGHDKDVILHGDAEYINRDGEAALFSKNTSFAQVPAVPFNPEGFTLAFWVDILQVMGINRNTLFSDLPSVGDLTFRVNWMRNVEQLIFTLYTKESVQRKFVEISTDKGTVDRGAWKHIAITWNKTEVKGQFVVDGNPVSSTLTGLPSILGSTPKISTRSHYELGSNTEVVETEKYLFRGYLKHLMVFDRTLNVDEIRHVMRWSEYGPWIGLSVMKHDNMFGWSDGSPIGQYVPIPTYKPNTPSTTKSCVAMKKTGKWINKRCNEKRPFICQKPIV